MANSLPLDMEQALRLQQPWAMEQAPRRLQPRDMGRRPPLAMAQLSLLHLLLMGHSRVPLAMGPLPNSPQQLPQVLPRGLATGRALQAMDRPLKSPPPGRPRMELPQLQRQLLQLDTRSQQQLPAAMEELLQELPHPIALATRPQALGNSKAEAWAPMGLVLQLLQPRLILPRVLLHLDSRRLWPGQVAALGLAAAAAPASTSLHRPPSPSCRPQHLFLEDLDAAHLPHAPQEGLVELPQELEAWGGVQGQVPQLALVHEALPLPSEQASAAAQHLLALASAAPW